MRAANGDLLERISLELAERPKIVERPEVKSDAIPKQLSVSLAKERFGKPMTTFSSTTSEIYARWQGQRLRQGAKVKAVWIAENIGEDFPRDYTVDEASSVAETPSAHGAFTLARPEGNGPGGNNLALFYVETRDADGALNGIRVERLKDKLGTRKVPTAELTLDGALATPVAGTENGIRLIAPMLNITRTWNAIGAGEVYRVRVLHGQGRDPTAVGLGPVIGALNAAPADRLRPDRAPGGLADRAHGAAGLG